MSLLLLFGGGSSAGYYYIQRTIDHTKVGGADLTNFVFPIYFAPNAVTELKSVPNGGKVQSTFGFDILVQANDLSARWNFQRVFYDPATGETLLWAQAPSASASVNTPHKITFGDATITTDQSTTATWDATFIAAYLFGDGVTLSGVDATGNGHALTTHGSPTAAGSQNFSGGAGSFNPSGTADDMVATVSSGLSGSFTVSQSLYPTAVPDQDNVVAESQVASYTNYWAALSGSDISNSGKWRANLYDGTHNPFVDSTSSVSANTWYRVALIRDSGFLRVAVQGAIEASVADSTTSVPSYSDFGIGRQASPTRAFHGRIGSLFIANVARTANWLLGEFNAIQNPSTFSTGTTVTFVPSTTTSIIGYTRAISRSVAVGTGIFGGGGKTRATAFVRGAATGMFSGAGTTRANALARAAATGLANRSALTRAITRSSSTSTSVFTGAGRTRSTATAKGAVSSVSVGSGQTRATALGRAASAGIASRAAFAVATSRVIGAATTLFTGSGRTRATSLAKAAGSSLAIGAGYVRAVSVIRGAVTAISSRAAFTRATGRTVATMAAVVATAAASYTRAIARAFASAVSLATGSGKTRAVTTAMSAATSTAMRTAYTRGTAGTRARGSAVHPRAAFTQTHTLARAGSTGIISAAARTLSVARGMSVALSTVSGAGYTRSQTRAVGAVLRVVPPSATAAALRTTFHSSGRTSVVWVSSSAPTIAATLTASFHSSGRTAVVWVSSPTPASAAALCATFHSGPRWIVAFRSQSVP